MKVRVPRASCVHPRVGCGWAWGKRSAMLGKEMDFPWGIADAGVAADLGDRLLQQFQHCYREPCRRPQGEAKGTLLPRDRRRSVCGSAGSSDSQVGGCFVAIAACLFVVFFGGRWSLKEGWFHGSDWQGAEVHASQEKGS